MKESAYTSCHHYPNLIDSSYLALKYTARYTAPISEGQ